MNYVYHADKETFFWSAEECLLVCVRKKMCDQMDSVIILTAASNGAVDQLSRNVISENRRISSDENQDQTQDSRKFFNFVRIGNSDTIAEDVRGYSLENLAKTNMQTKPTLSRQEGLKQIKSLELQMKPLVHKSGNPIPACEKRVNQLKTQIREIQLRMQGPNKSFQRELQQHLLQKADIIATTLNSSGSSVLDYLITSKRPILCVIVDEACQCTELDTLIPLRFKPTKMVLVGDPCQLPPTVLSKEAMSKLSGSLFVRCMQSMSEMEQTSAIKFLDTQYRMVPEIADFPSRHFYHARLKTAENVGSDSCYRLNPYVLFDLAYGKESRGASGSMQNVSEITFIRALCNFILCENCDLQPNDIGVITFYKDQVREMRNEFRSDRGLSDVEVNTVDGFQGREKKVIVLSCVRGGGNRIGFLDDKRRLTVAITRAKLGLYVVSQCKTLKSNEDWSALIEDARRRNFVFKINKPSETDRALQRLRPFQSHR